MNLWIAALLSAARNDIEHLMLSRRCFNFQLMKKNFTMSILPTDPESQPPLIDNSVGNMMTNALDDVLKVKEMLFDRGYYPEAPQNGYPDMPLDHAVKDYQRDHNLKIDGILRPGGETEQTLQTDILAQRQQQKHSGARRHILDVVRRAAEAQNKPVIMNLTEKRTIPETDSNTDAEEARDLPPLPARKPEPLQRPERTEELPDKPATSRNDVPDYRREVFRGQYEKDW